MISVLLVCLLSTGCSEGRLDGRLEEPFNAYIQAIKDYVGSSEYDVSGDIRYTLAYIDGDEIPELILSESSSHASGVRIYFYDFEQKKVVDLGDRFGELGGFSYYEKKSTIYDYYFGNGGYGNICFCKIGQDYRVSRSRYFTYYRDEKVTSHYYIDFAEVTQGEYDKAFAEDAPGFVEDKTITIEREDMVGDYRTCCSEDAVEFFFQILKRKEIS